MSLNYNTILDNFSSIPETSFNSLIQGQSPGDVAKEVISEVLTTIGGEQLIGGLKKAATGLIKKSQLGQDIIEELPEDVSSLSLEDALGAGYRGISKFLSRSMDGSSASRNRYHDPDIVDEENGLEMEEFSRPIDPDEMVDTAEQSIAETSLSGDTTLETAGATDTDLAGEAAASATADVAGETAGLATAETVADTTAAATAEIPGLDIVTGLAAAILGLFGLFSGHSSDDTPAPQIPVPPNVSTDIGIGRI